MSYTLQGTKCNLSRYMYTHVKILVIFIFKELELKFSRHNFWFWHFICGLISKNGLYSTVGSSLYTTYVIVHIYVHIRGGCYIQNHHVKIISRITIPLKKTFYTRSKFLNIITLVKTAYKNTAFMRTLL